jgi:putative transposase
MARRSRSAVGGVAYHVFNRGSRKGLLFASADEYIAFERLLAEGREEWPMRIIAYCLMPNHWHLLLWPEHDGDLSRFLHWITGTHGHRWRRFTRTQGEGAVYQGRFGSRRVLDQPHLFEVWRYIERNPRRGRPHLTMRRLALVQRVTPEKHRVRPHTGSRAHWPAFELADDRESVV